MSEKLGLPSLPASRADGDPPMFACALRADGLDTASVHVIGELDIATAPQLEQILRSAELRARRITLDLRELTFMDGAGLHVIVHASIRARRIDRRLILVRGPSQVDRLFAVTGASAVLETRDLNPHEPPVHLLPPARQDYAA